MEFEKQIEKDKKMFTENKKRIEGEATKNKNLANFHWRFRR